ncbi:hypothetical protein CIB48_g5309 [Xylaria polymorpha]|nr:hypothetical protein CIB48_g5309 [Xylaria polymorpha]
MFKRSFRSSDRVDKSARLKKSSNVVRDPQKLSKLQQSLEETLPVKRSLTSPIVTLMVGHEGRLFAAHEEVLCQSPFFERICQDQYLEAQNKRISLPDEEPEIFSAVLEYLYKGDYYPRLLHNKHRNSWELEDAELKRLSLRKQGLQSGIDVGTILRSAQYAYDNTPDTDSRLRAHYLALIIRCRKTFKRSGTMQAEMEKGGKLFFDLFVAMCNHLDDVVDMSNSHTPKTI